MIAVSTTPLPRAMNPPIIIAIVVVIVMMAPGCGSHLPLPPGPAPIALDAVPITYDDQVWDSFAISDDEWSRIAALFQPPRGTAAEERASIREAVGTLERIAGRQTPTSSDERKSKGGGSGKMDCVDESKNTTNYLRLLQERGLLHHHDVMRRAHRGLLQGDLSHYTAQVRDRHTGERYVVDSWFLPNGLPPYVQRTRDWMKKKPWPTEQAADAQRLLQARQAASADSRG